MKAIALGVAVIAVLVCATFATAGTMESGNARGGQGAVTAAAGGPTLAIPVTQDSWRFVSYKGRWWYWTPDSRWMYAENGGWVSLPPTRGRTGMVRPVAETTSEQAPSQAAATVSGNTCPLPTNNYPSTGASCPSPSTSAAYSFGTHGSAISFGF
jgi:hypothetical protein